jgi:hypothetical protein
LVLCAAVKFWSAVAYKKHIALFATYDIISALEKHLSSEKEELRGHCLTLLGNLGSSQGLLLLLSQKRVLTQLQRLFYQKNVECMQALSCLMQTNDSSACEQLASLFPTLVKQCVEFGKHAFEEHRIASYALLKSFASHDFGLQSIRDNRDGVLDFIFDVNRESSLLGKEWRQSIVENILCKESSSNILGQEIISRLLQCKRSSAPLVATESL